MSYAYRPDGTLSSRTSTPPVGAKWLRASTTSYDTLGRVSSARDGRGVVTTYGYDGLDRVRSVSYSDGTPSVSYSYDGSGNTLTSSDASGTTTVVYDNLNRVTARGVPNRPTLGYGYDQVGNLLSSVEGGSTTSYSYDPTNNLASVTEPDGAVTTFGYDNDDRRTRISYPAATGVVQTVAYDGAGRVKRVTSRKGTAAPLVDLEYCYARNSTGACATSPADDMNLLMWRQDHVSGKRTTYGYDGSQRLASAADGTRRYGYTYDKNSNRTSESVDGDLVQTASYQHDVADALCSRRTGVLTGANCTDTASTATTTVFAYDGVGNMTAAGATTAAYNGDGQTTRYGTPTFSYAGTGQGDRLTATTAAGTTAFTNGLLGTQQQITGGQLTDTTSTPDGQLVSITSPGQGKHYYLFDGQGSVVGLVGSTGLRTATYTYDPYGAHHTATGTAAAGNPYRYISGYLDSTGLYKLGIRYYNPDIGRFTQLDPSGLSQHYSYAANNPVNYSDPTGLFVSVPEGYVYSPNLGTLNDYCSYVADQYASVGQNADFRGPCARHDQCYGGSGDKFDCDTAFFSDLRENCRSAYGSFDVRRYDCYRVAGVYTTGVVVAS